MRILHKNADTIEQYRLATMEIVSGFYRFCANNSIDFNRISNRYAEQSMKKYRRWMKVHLTAWLIEVSMTISDKLKKCKKQYIQTACNRGTESGVRISYMEAEYITWMKCVRYLGYLIPIFPRCLKKETGKPFITYLTDYRMDIAADLMVNTNEKSYTIAEKVGYPDANYFSYVFKKRFGVSPSKYRTKYLQK